MSDEDLKLKILYNLTEKKYPNEFYTSMLRDYKDFAFEKFITEMIKIFA